MHYDLQGNWNKQAEILKERLRDCLKAIEYKQLTMDQMRFVINSYVVPKLTYALSVTSIIGKHTKLAATLDTTIRKFVFKYFGLSPTTTTHCAHAPLKHWGLGLYSIEDRVCGAVITNTTVALNDWQLSAAWDTQANLAVGPTRALYTQYRDSANQYPQALCGALHMHMLAKNTATFPMRHTSRVVQTRSVVNNLIRTLGSKGYSIDSPLYSTPQMIPLHTRMANSLHPAETWISRVLPNHTGNDYRTKIQPLVESTGITHMRDFLDPAGLRLLDWNKFRKHAIQLRADAWPRTRPSARQATQANRVLPDNPPKWFLSLDAELLMENEHLKSGRYVKPLYQDMPALADEEQRWAASVTPRGELRLHKPTGANALHGQHGNVEVLTYTFTTSPNNPAGPMTHTHTTENLNLETTVLVHIATPLMTSELSEEENPICIHLVEHEHIRQHTENVTTRVLAAVHGSHQTHPSHEYEDPDLTPQPTTAHACATDGSKFTVRDLHGTETQLCGAAAAAWPTGSTQAHPNHAAHKHVRAPPRIKAEGAYTTHDPAELSSTHPEAEALLLALEDDNICPEGETCSIAIDNQGVLSAQSKNPHQTTREFQRTNMHYTIAHTRSLLNNENHENVSLHKVAAHTGDAHNEWVDGHAKLAAGMACMYPPQRFPHPLPNTLFHLYYYDNLVSDDIRGHVDKACTSHHRKNWEDKKQHGKLHVAARLHNTSLERRHAKTYGKVTRKAEKLLTKIASGGLYTPSKKAKQDTTGQHNAKCPLCDAAEADDRHALLSCGHKDMVELREELDSTLIGAMTDGLNKNRPYDGHHALLAHPATLIPPGSLYPYSVDFPELAPGDPTPLIRDFLPEARFYRPARNGTTKIQDPMRPNAPHATIINDVFWRLIACHPLSHARHAQPLCNYSARATALHATITAIPDTDLSERMSWATPRELLHIITDELQVTTELFSNILNAYHPIRTHYTAPGINPNPNNPFAELGGFKVNGFDLAAYIGSVYGNPPYDTTSIARSMKLARKAAESPGFRAVYVVPMTDETVRTWEDKTDKKGVRQRLLTVFPRLTVPFLTARRWKTGNECKSPYKDPEDLTRIVVAIIEHGDPTRPNSLQPINDASYHKRIQQWFASITPPSFTQEFQPKNCTDLHEGPSPLAQAFPAEWMFWRERTEMTREQQYPGGALDALSLNITPFYDACTHDPMITLMGALPASFPALLQGMGHPTSSAGTTTRTVRNSLLAHLKGTWATYLSLCADARDLTRIRKKRATVEDNDKTDTSTGPPPLPPTGARARPPAHKQPNNTRSRRSIQRGKRPMNDSASLAVPRRETQQPLVKPPNTPGSSSSHARYNENATSVPPMIMPTNETRNAPLPTERRWEIPVASTRDSQDRTILALHADAPNEACLCDDEIHATVQGLTNSPLNEGTYPSCTYPGHQSHQTLLTSLDAFSMREMSAEELQREGRCVLKAKLGWTAAPFTQICGAGHHWVSVGFWPKHRTAYLYDPLDSFPSTLKTQLQKTLTMAWTIYDINQRTQFDSYQCGTHAILFAHLILALTTDGPSNIAPLNRSILTLNRRPEQADNPTQLLVTLREYLVDLKPEGPKTLRAEYTNLLARLHPNIYEQLPGDTIMDDTDLLQGHGSPGHEPLTDAHSPHTLDHIPSRNPRASRRHSTLPGAHPPAPPAGYSGLGGLGF